MIAYSITKQISKEAFQRKSDMHTRKTSEGNDFNQHYHESMRFFI